MAYSATSQDRALAAINITPLVDVMLVAAGDLHDRRADPVASRRIELNLPQPGPDRAADRAIRLRIDAAGRPTGTTPHMLRRRRAQDAAASGSRTAGEPG